LLERRQATGTQHHRPHIGLRHPLHEHTMTSQRPAFEDMPASGGCKTGDDVMV
jgi:hypothetical protein